MGTGDFYSFYHAEMPYDKAKLIVNNFMNEIFQKNIDEWIIYSIKPDFLNSVYAMNDSIGEEDYNELFSYFAEGGNDSCTVFFNSSKLYILLTNGEP